ncbi:MAG: type I restriction enzyme HsdR N-terminal domain-containing protein [Flavobacteriales bacterium]|nr:type I restriction enzyme HsdR N-terminal domain-containing protein [Flavobacteriales bacterium]
MFPPLNLPACPLRTEMRDGRPMVLCMVRRKWVVLTPEEWVRQHLTAHLHHGLGHPLSLMRMERQVKGGARTQRADISIHDSQGTALMLVECKAPDEPLNRETLFQAGRYNRHIQAGHLLISNGMQHFCCRVQDGALHFLDAIPTHTQLTGD